jgi:midasin
VQVWVPPLDDADDVEVVIRAHLPASVVGEIAPRMLAFWMWHHSTQATPGHAPLSLRDMLAWCQFVKQTADFLGPHGAYVHGAFLVVIDGQGLGSGMAVAASAEGRAACTDFLRAQLPEAYAAAVPVALPRCAASSGGTSWGIEPFHVATGGAPSLTHYHLTAPTTAQNAWRILRAMQICKPILMEGPPGVGKSSLVAAMAAAAGHPLVRINLSEQTDVLDLLGADLPVDGGAAGTFRWSDGPLVSAMRSGAWVLLDELNLASQQVLEGLNAVLDHRREVFLPELGETIRCSGSFRVFAAQNPVQDGGGRKGLPQSFLNRFSRVAVEPLRKCDLRMVAASLHPGLPEALLEGMVEVVSEMHERVSVGGRFGGAGAPWEFNLRDMLRWCELVEGAGASVEVAAHYARMLFIDRFRTPSDRAAARAALAAAWPPAVSAPAASKALVTATPSAFCVGAAVLPRIGRRCQAQAPAPPRAAATAAALAEASEPVLEWAAVAAEHGWMVLLTTADVPHGARTVRTLAQHCSQPLAEISLTPSSDTSDLLGCFEQMDCARAKRAAASAVHTAVSDTICRLLTSKSLEFSTAVAAASTLATDASRLCDASLDALARLLEAVRTAAAPLLHTRQQQHLAPAAAAIMAAAALASEAESSSLGGRFAWADGTLLAAIENGGWVMMLNANTCSSAVLDRLNSLLETSGTLYLNECGNTALGPRMVQPHPDFRLFLVADPTKGEISPAMRNRGIEVSFSGGALDSPDVAPRLNSFQVRVGPHAGLPAGPFA